MLFFHEEIEIEEIEAWFVSQENREYFDIKSTTFLSTS